MNERTLCRSLTACIVILAVAAGADLYLTSCANLTPAERTTLADVSATAVNAGIGYLTGGKSAAVAAASPSAVATLQEATYALRTTENPASSAVPTADQINAIILAVAQNPQVSKAITPAVAKSIAAAVKSGAPPAAAVEAAASGLDTVTTAYSRSSTVSSIRPPRFGASLVLRPGLGPGPYWQPALLYRTTLAPVLVFQI